MGNKPTKTPEEQQQEVKAIFRCAIRETDKQIRNINRSLIKCKTEMNKYAKMGNKQALTTMAKQYRKMQKSIERAEILKGQYHSMETDYLIQKQQVNMSTALANFTSVMKNINSNIDIDRLTKTLNEYENMSNIQAVISESIERTLEDLDPDEEQEIDETVDSVLKEVGLDAVYNAAVAGKSALPGQRVANSQTVSTGAISQPF